MAMKHGDEPRPSIRRLALDVSPATVFSTIAEEPGAVFLDSALPRYGAFSYLACGPALWIADALPPIRPSVCGRSSSEIAVAARAPRSPASVAEKWSSVQHKSISHNGSLVQDATAVQDGNAAPLPPFRSGWIGFLAYESASLWNRDLRTRGPEPALPRAWWGRYDAVLAFRHADGAWFLSCREGAERQASLLEERIRAATPGHLAGPVRSGDPIPELSLDEWRSGIETILDWIGRGHIYQANLTYRISFALSGSPAALYGVLRETNPAPWGAFLRLSGNAVGRAGDDLSILSSSPELFLKVRGGIVETRPIKGTRPRDPGSRERDRSLARALLASEKDRAELTMIVDLERNDLGRLCRSGSISVGRFPRLESFRSVHHLTATVRGELSPGVTMHDLIAATFPGGSVTGAPKIRAMEILADLERAPRFVYTGALGWVEENGDMELALPIRTLWSAAGAAHLGVGCGIVADSGADSEWEESRDKAAAVLEALGAAARAASPLRT